MNLMIESETNILKPIFKITISKFSDLEENIFNKEVINKFRKIAISSAITIKSLTCVLSSKEA